LEGQQALRVCLAAAAAAEAGVQVIGVHIDENEETSQLLACWLLLWEAVSSGLIFTLKNINWYTWLCSLAAARSLIALTLFLMCLLNPNSACTNGYRFIFSLTLSSHASSCLTSSAA